MSIIRPPYTGDPVLDSWTNQITQYLNIGLLPGVNTPSGSDGAGANGNTTIYLYQKTASATAPAAPTSVSYDYSDLDDVTVTANNGWTGAVPGTTLKYLWVTFRYVSKLVDTITNSNTWNTPVLLASNGDDGATGSQGETGAAGLNTATVLLHNKNSSSSAPSLFSGTFTYTFSTGALSGGSLNGWTQTAPSLSIGEFLFSSSAVASANTSTDTVASSEFSTPQVTGSSGTNGTNGTNGDVSRTLYLYDASINQPSAIANNAGFNSSTGNASNTGTWTTTVPTVPSNQGLWIAAANITRTNNAGSFAGGGWTIYRATGNTGANGTNGNNGPKFASSRLYKAAVAGSQGSAPSANITWSTGNIFNITSGWSLTPPTQVASSTTLVWSSDLFFIDTSGFAGASNATGTTPVQSTSFSGLVTFNSGDFRLDGSTITSIDGGNITAGSLTVTNADIQDLTVQRIKIAGSAVSDLRHAETGPRTQPSNQSYNVIHSLTIPVIANIPIFVSAAIMYGPSSTVTLGSMFVSRVRLFPTYISGGLQFWVPLQIHENAQLRSVSYKLQGSDSNLLTDVLVPSVTGPVTLNFQAQSYLQNPNGTIATLPMTIYRSHFYIQSVVK